MTYKQKAKITYIGGDWAEYTVHSALDCRDATDLAAYQSAIQNQRTITLGKVCVTLLD